MTTRVKRNYYPRVMGFFIPAIIGLIVIYNRKATLYSIDSLLFVLVGFGWPHLAYLYAKKSKNLIRSEFQNMMADSFFVGMFISLMSFSLFPSVAALSQIFINNFSIGGAKLFLKSLIFLILGYVVFLPLSGFQIITQTSTLVSVLSIFQILIYVSFVGIVIHIQTTKLIRLRRTIAEKNVELESEKNKLQLKNEFFEHEISLARKIQEQLIPSEQKYKFLFSLYKPMEDVGGDFYDFIEFEESNNIGIFVSDVSGHGVPAALITSMIKTIILQGDRRIYDPAALLLYMNKILETQTAGNFVTAFYGIYNPDDHSLLYSNAGHNQPYIISSEKVTQIQGGKNTAVAMFSNNMLASASKKFENYEETLDVGSKLLLYTDGLVEARPIDGDTFFEHANMEKFFIENSNHPCKKFIENLLKELTLFRKTESFDDDICLICLDIQ